MAVLGGDALGMELHAVHGVALVLHAHDEAVGGLGRDLERVGQARALDDQRMVARRREVLRDAVEDALAGMVHLGSLPCIRRRRADDPAAIGLADRLVAEADAEDRHLRPARSISSRQMPARSGCKARARARWPRAPRPAPRRR